MTQTRNATVQFCFDRPPEGVARVYRYVLVTKHKAPKAWYASRPDPDNNLRHKK
jgi:hypothetical protein